MVKPIVIYGDPILNIESSEVKKGTPGISLLLRDMFETMHKANGVGLSAIQIGIPLRIFTIEAHLEKENFHFRGIFINPNIIREFGNLIKHPEGCLSVPGIAALVERLESIEMEWYDENWEYHKEIFSGFDSRIIQHEYDHLDGLIYIDRLDKMWKDMIDPSLELIKERSIEIPYLIKP